MTIKSSVLVGPLEVPTLYNPFVSLPHETAPGPPLGLDTESPEPFCLNPWWFKNNGDTHSTSCMFLGDKKHGKSATMKIAATRLMILAAGDERTRVAINDHKPEGRDSEYAEFSKYHNSKPFRIGEMSVNPFEIALYRLSSSGTTDYAAHELGILGTAETLSEFGKAGRLDTDEHTALRIEIAHMLKHREEFWSPQLLAKLLMSVEESDVTAYFASLDFKLQKQLESRMDRLEDPMTIGFTADQIQALVYGRTNNYDLAALRAAGMRVSAYLGRILHGSYGNMFGDRHSLYGMLTQRVITKDWRGVEAEPARLMRMLLNDIRISAIECNNQQLLPTIELDDEKHTMMEHLDYARSEAHLGAISRGIKTFTMSATHRYDSIRFGDVGSEHYRLGNTIINNLGMVFIGKLSGDEQMLDEVRSLHGLTQTETQSLTTLPPHTFLVKIGDAPRRYVKVFATPEDMTYIKSDSASESVTEKRDISSPDYLKQFAKNSGLTYTGSTTLKKEPS